MGRWLVLALEFQVAAKILRTVATPTRTDLGQLAAVIVLRTVLNYVLRREIAVSAILLPEIGDDASLTPPQPGGQRGARRSPPRRSHTNTDPDGSRTIGAGRG